MDNQRRVSARVTEVRNVSTEDAHNFLQENHRQGAISSKTPRISVGLYFNDELLAVAQFCRPRTAGMKREYSTELLRLAFKENIRIPGGASKLFKNYIRMYDPFDVFTYQDTTGEVTDVYEAAGFAFVRQAKQKQYLVAPEKTLNTAKRGEYYSIASVVMRGPDALLGTALGEVFHSDGKRKTNPELFIDELGWHLEETSGDRVYEWVNPDRTFYTYKITSTDSDKYYYGVSHVKKANASKDECLNDGYYGSGGKHKRNKFSNWKAKHQATLKKEILGVFNRQAKAYYAEKELIGDLYKTDPNCLNSTTGGKDGGLHLQRSIASRAIAICPVHGASAHQGDTCIKCFSIKRYTIKDCSTHGQVKHTKNGCVTCALDRKFTTQTCAIHGETTFRNENCVKCSNNRSQVLRKCNTHGVTKFIGDRCYKCIHEAKPSFSENECAIHGVTLFRGDTCAKCSARKSLTDESCSKHGLTIHRGGVCQSCINEKTVHTIVCDIHGEVKTQNGTCTKCSAKTMFSKQICAVHGLSTFRKDKCISCAQKANQEMRTCEIHGLTLHQKDRCCMCVSQKSMHTRDHVGKNKPSKACSYCVQ